MLPWIPRPAVSRRQKAAALAVAGVVDLLQIAVFPVFMEGVASPLQDGLDVVAAIALTGVCGFRWQFGLAFLVELLPFVDIFPTWTAVVLTLHTRDAEGDRGAPRRAESALAQGEGSLRGEEGADRQPIEGEAVVVPPVQAPRRRDGG